MILNTPRCDRLVAMILADTESVRLLDRAHDCRSVAELEQLTRERVARALRCSAASEPKGQTLLSRDALDAKHLTDQLNWLLATDRD